MVGKTCHMATSCFGERLKEVRGSRTLAQIAEAVGVTEATVSRWETGKREPRGREIVKLAEHLNVDPRYFTGDIDTILPYGSGASATAGSVVPLRSYTDEEILELWQEHEWEEPTTRRRITFEEFRENFVGRGNEPLPDRPAWVTDLMTHVDRSGEVAAAAILDQKEAFVSAVEQQRREYNELLRGFMSTMTALMEEVRGLREDARATQPAQPTRSPASGRAAARRGAEGRAGAGPGGESPEAETGPASGKKRHGRGGART